MFIDLNFEEVISIKYGLRKAVWYSRSGQIPPLIFIKFGQVI